MRFKNGNKLERNVLFIIISQVEKLLIKTDINGNEHNSKLKCA